MHELAVEAERHIFPMGFMTIQPLKKINQNYKKFHFNWWNWGPVRTLGLARRDSLSLRIYSILVGIIKNIYLQPMELNPGVDNWRQICNLRAAFHLPGLNSCFSLVDIFPIPSTSPKLLKISSLSTPPCFSWSSFSVHVPCANTS